MDNGNLGINLVYTYAGNPQGVSTQAFNPPKGSIVIDTSTPAVWIKTSTSDNSAYAGTVGSTLTAPLISGGLTASGSGANTFAGSTGTFATSTGANTLNGAVTINAATTPSLTTAAGKTNTGFVQINGKTSGALKFIPDDASAFTITVTNAAQTTAGTTLTIPDFASVADTFAFVTLAQTFVNKTLTAPVINGATSASGNFDLSGSSGTFRTSTGAATFGGSSNTFTNALTMGTAGQGLVLKQGSNGLVGTFVCNGATPVTVSSTAVAITDAIIISLNTVGGTVGAVPAVKTITAGSGFTVAGTASDTSTYNWAIIKNAA